MTTWLTPKTGWRFYKQSRRNLQTNTDGVVIVVKLGSNPLEDEQLKFSAFSSPDDLCKFVLRVRTGFGCLEKNIQPTDEECEQYTHKYSTYRVAQHDHTSSREHAWLESWKAQDCTSLCPETIVILVLCRTWHWPPAKVLSHPFHPLLLPFRQSSSRPIFPCDVPRQSGGSTHPISHACWRSLNNWVACPKIQSHRRGLFHGRVLLGSNCTVKFSKGTWHHTKIRERQGPSQGVIQKKVWTSRVQSVCAKIWG